MTDVISLDDSSSDEEVDTTLAAPATKRIKKEENNLHSTSNTEFLANHTGNATNAKSSPASSSSSTGAGSSTNGNISSNGNSSSSKDSTSKLQLKLKQEVKDEPMSNSMQDDDDVLMQDAAFDAGDSNDSGDPCLDFLNLPTNLELQGGKSPKSPLNPKSKNLFEFKAALKNSELTSVHYERHLERIKPKFAPFPKEFTPRMKEALLSLGIERLYTHQVETWKESYLEKKNVFLTTSFASGKSLAYTLPLLSSFEEVAKFNAENQSSGASSNSANPAVVAASTPKRPKAFLLFPTKALAQDQCGKLKKFEALGFFKVCTFDGDTPFHERKRLLETCDLFLTNPDTLHATILKEHRKNNDIKELLLDLKFIILDEAHVYTGRFGAHVSCVLRRLRRALRKLHEDKILGTAGGATTTTKATGKATAAKKKAAAKKTAGKKVKEEPLDGTDISTVNGGALPPTTSTAPSTPAQPLPASHSSSSYYCQFIACSATMLKPVEFFHELVDTDVKVIDDSGAGRGSKHVVLWQPKVRMNDYETFDKKAAQKAKDAKHAKAVGKNKDKKEKKDKKAKEEEKKPIPDAKPLSFYCGPNKGAATATASSSSSSSSTSKSTDVGSLLAGDDLDNAAIGENGRLNPMDELLDNSRHLRIDAQGLFDDIAYVFVEAVKRNVKTVLFVQSRALVELILDRVLELIKEGEKNMWKKAAKKEKKAKKNNDKKEKKKKKKGKKDNNSSSASDNDDSDVDMLMEPPVAVKNELDSSSSMALSPKTAASLADRIGSYRAGYTIEERRKIEQRFFNGDTIGLVATNALELGIDVGDLQCTLHLGLPRVVASLWQQMGRSGRGFHTDSMSVVIGIPMNGTDNYYMNNPEEFFERQDVVCSSSLPTEVLQPHLFCAASEYEDTYSELEKVFLMQEVKNVEEGTTSADMDVEQPSSSSSSEENYFDHENNDSETLQTNYTKLAKEMNASIIKQVAEIYRDPKYKYNFHENIKTKKIQYCHPPKTKNCHAALSIREIEVHYDVYEKTNLNSKIDSLEESLAYLKLYPGAVYKVQKNTYIVEDLDVSNKVVIVKRQFEALNYYTKARDRTDIIIAGNADKNRTAKKTGGGAEGLDETNAVFDVVKIFKKKHRLYHGQITTLMHILGYHKMRKTDGGVEDTIDSKLAPLKKYHTACWIELGELGENLKNGVHALEHAILLLAPVFGISDVLFTQHYRKEGQDHVSKLLIWPYSRTLQENLSKLIMRSAKHIYDCGCVNGCPNCIFDGNCQGGSVSKAEVKELLEQLGYVHGDYTAEMMQPSTLQPTVMGESSEAASPLGKAPATAKSPAKSLSPGSPAPAPMAAINVRTALVSFKSTSHNPPTLEVFGDHVVRAWEAKCNVLLFSGNMDTRDFEMIKLFEMIRQCMIEKATAAVFNHNESTYAGLFIVFECVHSVDEYKDQTHRQWHFFLKNDSTKTLVKRYVGQQYFSRGRESHMTRKELIESEKIKKKEDLPPIRDKSIDIPKGRTGHSEEKTRLDSLVDELPSRRCVVPVRVNNTENCGHKTAFLKLQQLQCGEMLAVKHMQKDNSFKLRGVSGRQERVWNETVYCSDIIVNPVHVEFTNKSELDRKREFYSGKSHIGGGIGYRKKPGDHQLCWMNKRIYLVAGNDTKNTGQLEKWWTKENRTDHSGTMQDCCYAGSSTLGRVPHWDDGTVMQVFDVPFEIAVNELVDSDTIDKNLTAADSNTTIPSSDSDTVVPAAILKEKFPDMVQHLNSGCFRWRGVLTRDDDVPALEGRGHLNREVVDYKAYYEEHVKSGIQQPSPGMKKLLPAPGEPKK